MKRLSCLASLILGSCLVSTEYVGTTSPDGGALNVGADGSFGVPEAGTSKGDSAIGDGGPLQGADAGGSCVPGSRADGTWRMLPAPTTDEPSAVWATGPTNVWVASWRNTTVHHWNGAAWTSMVTPGTTMYGLNDIWGTGPSDVWAVGSNGIVNHWDGTRWTASGSFLPSDHFWRVWGTGTNDVWAAGSAGLLAHWDGARWTRAPEVGFPDAGGDDGSRSDAPAIQALWGSSAGDVWSAGYQIFEHFDGSRWSTHMTTGTQVSDMWGSGPNDIWAVGSGGAYYQEGVLYHWDGVSWTETRHTPTLHGVWGAHAKDVWVVGQQVNTSKLLHWDGCSWSSVPVGSNGLSSIWGAQGHVWIPGSSGILQYQPASTSDAGVATGFELHTLDPEAKGATPVSLAAHGDVIGVTYFVTPESGPSELRYVELGKQPQVVAQVTRVYGGGTLAYDSSGTPNVAYLGPPGNGNAIWPESKALVARLTDGVWMTTVAASVPDQVVGLYSAIAIDENDKVHVAYRDVHWGQFPVQDWQHSRVGVASGTAAQGFQGFTDATAVDGANRVEGHGGQLSIALRAAQPMLAYSGMPGGAADVPQDVWFVGRTVDGWPVAPTKVRAVKNPGAVSISATGEPGESLPSLALTWIEDNRVFLTTSPTGVVWSAPEALTPEFMGVASSASCAHDNKDTPAVAYSYCLQGACPTGEVRLAFKENGAYRHLLVDPSGGQAINLAYWKRRAVVAYRDPTGTAIRLAVQR